MREGLNPWFLLVLGAAWVLVHVQRGGCTRISGLGVPQPLSFISLILLWLSPVNRTRPCRTGEKGGDESDPPKKRGGM